MNVDDAHIGRRVREIRTWRGLSLTVTAGLAGITHSYLSMIERGLRPVTKRSLLEALANALRVSPAELIGKPYAPVDAPSDKAHAGMADVEDALTGWWVGEIPDALSRPWPVVRADVDRLNLGLRPNAEYSEQAALLPGLIRDLLAAVANSEQRKGALIGLMGAYKAAAYLAHDLGFAGLPALAAERMRQVAEELGDPVWIAYAAYQRAQLISGNNRARQYELAVAVADRGASRVEVNGMAHLTAAIAAASQRQSDTAETHLAEARSLAESIDTDVSPWMQTNFGRTNVGMWRVAIGLELGLGARVVEIASKVRPESVSKSRQAAFWIDYGRGLLTERKHQDRGLIALLRAEQLAPEKVRNNVFAREAVSTLLTRMRRDAGGRDLRGLAHRMGIAP